MEKTRPTLFVVWILMLISTASWDRPQVQHRFGVVDGWVVLVVLGGTGVVVQGVDLGGPRLRPAHPLGRWKCIPTIED
jgi:hypothetical protein